MNTIIPNLSDQQVCFCDEYLVSFNAYRSAVSAGYSENTARKGELLHIPKIQEYLRLKMQQRGERMEITHDMILREYAKVAFSSMGNYYDERGDLKPMCELTETEKAAISQFQIVDIAEADGYKVGSITKIKLHNKMAALDKIARHLGFFERGKKQEAGSLKPEAIDGLEVAIEMAANENNEASVIETPEFAVNVEQETVLANVDALPLSDDEVGLVMKEVGESTRNILTLSPLADGQVRNNVLLRSRIIQGELAS